jgi:addiction module HigA family antidote
VRRMYTSPTTIEQGLNMTRKMNREPTSPGEILREEFLEPLDITQRQLAEHIGCDVKVINRIVNAQCDLSAEMAVRIAMALGTSAQFWMNLQQEVSLYRAEKGLERAVKPMPQLHPAHA